MSNNYCWEKHRRLSKVWLNRENRQRHAELRIKGKIYVRNFAFFHGKNGFAKVFKNLIRCRSESNPRMLHLCVNFTYKWARALNIKLHGKERESFARERTEVFKNLGAIHFVANTSLIKQEKDFYELTNQIMLQSICSINWITLLARYRFENNFVVSSK